MPDFTDDAVAKAVQTASSRDEIERILYFAEQHRQIIEAAGIDETELSPQGHRILRWLGKWDDWTTGGLVEILTAARSAAVEDMRREHEPDTPLSRPDNPKGPGR